MASSHHHPLLYCILASSHIETDVCMNLYSFSCNIPILHFLIQQTGLSFLFSCYLSNHMLLPAQLWKFEFRVIKCIILKKFDQWFYAHSCHNSTAHLTDCMKFYYNCLVLYLFNYCVFCVGAFVCVHVCMFMYVCVCVCVCVCVSVCLWSLQVKATKLLLKRRADTKIPSHCGEKPIGKVSSLCRVKGRVDKRFSDQGQI